MMYKVAAAFPNLSYCSQFEQFNSSVADIEGVFFEACCHIDCWGSMTLPAF